MFVRLQLWITLSVGIALLAPINLSASEKESVSWGGFIDSYYAYDGNNPSDHDRSFTTQPARHNEFNVNLVFIDGKVSSEDVRGRLALQAGTSVQNNYAGEPTLGAVSGPTLSRHIQEAVVGYRPVENLWIDAGIYFSHIGFESFISRDNWTYSRSLVADFSPFYQAGVKLSYQLSEKWSTQVHILNGWQNISENNMGRSLGTQISFTPNSSVSVTYNTFVGKEAEFRHFHDFVLKYTVTEKFQLATQFDVGFQKKTTGDSYNTWYGGALIARYAFTEKLALATRFERYVDKHQIIVSSGSANGFQTWSTSVNVDAQLHPRVLWRTEIRGFWSKDDVYPSSNASARSSDGVFMSSLALTI